MFDHLVRLDNWLYGEYQNRMGFFKNLIEEDLKEAKEFRKVRFSLVIVSYLM